MFFKDIKLLLEEAQLLTGGNRRAFVLITKALLLVEKEEKRQFNLKIETIKDKYNK